MAIAKKSARQRITDTLIEKLESGNVPPWSKPWRTMRNTLSTFDGVFPCNHVSGHDYSGVNVLLLWCAKEEQGYSRNRWMTFKQAQTKGGNVRKGERGTTICYAGTFKKEGNLLDANGHPIEEEHRFLKTYSVFNLDQIEGLDEPAPQPLPVKPAQPVPDRPLADLMAALDVRLHHGGDRAFYRHVPYDEIHMPTLKQFKTEDSYASVLAHELTHWTGAKHRLDRKFGKRKGDANYAFEELVAEIGAAFICAEYGIDHTSQAATYLQSWLKGMKDHPQMIISAASMASKALDYIREEALAADEPAPVLTPAMVTPPGAPAPQLALSV